MDNEMAAINNSEGFFGNSCSLCPALCLTPNPNSKSNFNFRTCDPHASYSNIGMLLTIVAPRYVTNCLYVVLHCTTFHDYG